MTLAHGLGLGLEGPGLGLGLGLESPGLGLGLGLESPGLGLGLGLKILALTTSLDYIPCNQICFFSRSYLRIAFIIFTFSH